MSIENEIIQLETSTQQKEAAFKMAYQMTASEYIEIVVPKLKEYFKFLKKNSNYFVKKDYCGIEYVNWSQYVEKCKAKSHYSENYTKEWWGKATQTFTEPVMPDYETERLKNYMFTIIKRYFTEYDIAKFEKDELKSNKRSVKRAIDKDNYINDLIDGEITTTRLQEIFASVKVNIPGNILKMKSKVDNNGYNRNVYHMFMQASADMEQKIRKSLEPHTDKIKERYKNYVERTVADYITWCELLLTEVKKSRFVYESDYAGRKTQTREGYLDLTNLLRIYTEESKKISNYDIVLENKAVVEAEYFISTFISRIQEKLKIITERKGLPIFTVERLNFHGDKIEGTFSIEYADRTKLIMETDVILAGGYNVQKLHERYLMKVFMNGKMIDLEKIDKEI